LPRADRLAAWARAQAYLEVRDRTTVKREPRSSAPRTTCDRTCDGPDGPHVVRAQGLTKFYGHARGVVDLDLSVDGGEVFGYLPGDLRLYERLTARDVFSHFAHLRGLDDLSHAFGLAERLELEVDRPINALSKGNRQKVGLVQAFMHSPDLLVLDEPTAGLDPLIQQTFYELIAEVKAAGATVFLSSHVLPEVQHVADRVALIRDGRLVLVAGVDELRSHALARVEVTFATLPPPGAFATVTGVRELERHGHSVLFALEGEADALVKSLARHRVVAINSHEADLEDIFLSLYRSEEVRNAA
jgi:ABC-2 type transport system ATP-binding protein